MFLFGAVMLYGLSTRLKTSSKASGVDCPPNSESQGTWCDYRHTTDENNRDAPILNPNYLDTYNDCWDKCVKLDTTQCNGTCHYGSATVCVQKDAWANNATQCSFICNWACCGGKPKISACTGGPVVPTATRSPVNPTTKPQPTQPPYVPPTQPPATIPTVAPHITIVQPTQAPPTGVPAGSLDYKNLNPNDGPGNSNNPDGTAVTKPADDPLAGVTGFWEQLKARVGFEFKLNSKRVVYFFQSAWFVLIQPFKHP